MDELNSYQIFSETAHRLQGSTNRLYRERNRRLAFGDEVIDLISGNVNQHGIHYPEEKLQKAFLEGMALSKNYQPDPRGQVLAREAIASYYNEAGLAITADQIIITPGTSLSYWYAFTLLANHGDEILVPQPTYPLFESIAGLSGIHLRHYPLIEKGRWQIDLDQLESQVGPKTRGIILISPHNPTGAVATESEIAGVSEIASRHRLPILSDEVFSPFLFQRSELPRPATTEAPLVITLNGLSKMYALPGLKLGWMVLSGDPMLTKKGMEALETISDTFLPVHEIGQKALPTLIKEGKAFLTSYQSEIKNRAERAFKLLSQSRRFSIKPPEGGFYITVEIHDPKPDDEAFALELLDREGVLVHPGYFYELEKASFVMSCVPTPEILERGVAKIIRFAEKS